MAQSAAPDSPMLQLLGRDSGARQSLMQMLAVKDLVSLLRSGRSWSAWIAESPSVGGASIKLNHRSQQSFFDCHWIRRSVQSIHYESNEGDPLRFDQLIGSLHGFNRLRSLTARFNSGCDNAPLLQQRLSFMATSMRHLEVTITGTWLDVTSLLSAIVALPLLESLDVTLRSLEDWDRFLDDELDEEESEEPPVFSSLPTLSKLQRFSLMRDDIKTRVPITREIVAALSNCKALTDLCYGHWVLELKDCYNLPNLMPSQVAHIEVGIAALVRLRKENGAAPLRRLCLGFAPVIVPENWQWLSQCIELESIAAAWRMDPEGWMQLAHFQQLQSLRIDGLFDGAPVLPGLAPILAPLIHCRALRSLTLVTMNMELRAADAGMLARIPALEHLSCYGLSIETLEPLSDAPALTSLEFESCAGLERASINIRELIPAMPRVNKLTIHELDANRLNAQEAEPCNVPLLQRLPSLTLEHFTQLNLRPHPDSMD